MKLVHDMGTKNIKYLYILGSVSRVTYEFIKMIKSRYNEDEHVFYIPMGKIVLTVEPEFGIEKNVIFPDSSNKFKQFFFEYNLYRKAENIILHGIFFPNSSLIPFFINNDLMKRISWIEHGGDLYNWKDERNIFRSKVINWMNRKVREASNVVGICHPLDQSRLCQEFNIKSPVIYTQFRTIDDPFTFFESVKPTEKSNKKAITVQVGHNAFELGRHIQILDFLEHYKDEDIKLVLPMSYGLSGIKGKYGGIHYRNAVYKVAKSIFGKKAVLMFRKIPLVNYNRYLWGVDIVILNLERQAGLGNIHPLLYMNKKIFLPSDSPMYKFFKSQGVEIYDTYNIKNMNFEEFIAPNKNDNSIWVREFLTHYSYETWDKFFYELEKTEKGR